MQQLGILSTLSVGFISSPDQMSGTPPARGDLLHGLRHQCAIHETISRPFNSCTSMIVVRIIASARKQVSFRKDCRLLVIWHSIIAVSSSRDPIKKKPTSPLQPSKMNLVPSSTRLSGQRKPSDVEVQGSHAETVHGNGMP